MSDATLALIVKQMPCWPELSAIWKFQALQLIVLAVFGAVDEQLASCILAQFLEI